MNASGEWRSISGRAHQLGEGSRIIDGRLHWVDLLRGELHAWTAEQGRTLVRSVDRPLGFVERHPDGRLLAAAGVGIVDLSGDDLRGVAETPLDPETFRINDGAVAPDGSVWFGMMAYDSSAHPGSVWRYDPSEGSLERILDDIGIPNGPTFVPGTDAVLIADTTRGVIHRTSTSDPSSDPVHFAVVTDGSPDGIFVDRGGRVWNAVWGGSRLDLYDLSGGRIAGIPVPVSQPTSVVVTDDDLVIVTSAIDGLTDAGALDGHTIARPLDDVLADATD